MILPKGTLMDCPSSTLCENEDYKLSRQKRFVNNVDPEKVIKSVWGTKAISVQLTDQVGWNSFRIFGYIVGGKDIFLVYFHFLFLLFVMQRSLSV